MSGFFARLRDLLSGPAHVSDGGDPEAAADLHDELGTPDEGAADVKWMADTGGLIGSFDRAEGAEAAEEDLESEEAPPDPNP